MNSDPLSERNARGREAEGKPWASPDRLARRAVRAVVVFLLAFEGSPTAKAIRLVGSRNVMMWRRMPSRTRSMVSHAQSWRGSERMSFGFRSFCFRLTGFALPLRSRRRGVTRIRSGALAMILPIVETEGHGRPFSAHHGASRTWTFALPRFGYRFLSSRICSTTLCGVSGFLLRSGTEDRAASADGSPPAALRRALQR